MSDLKKTIAKRHYFVGLKDQQYLQKRRGCECKCEVSPKIRDKWYKSTKPYR